jgi:hypothetical protein
MRAQGSKIFEEPAQTGGHIVLVTGERIFCFPTGMTTIVYRTILQHITILIIWTWAANKRNNEQLEDRNSNVERKKSRLRSEQCNNNLASNEGAPKAS